MCLGIVIKHSVFIFLSDSEQIYSQKQHTVYATVVQGTLLLLDVYVLQEHVLLLDMSGVRVQEPVLLLAPKSV